MSEFGPLLITSPVKTEPPSETGLPTQTSESQSFTPLTSSSSSPRCTLGRTFPVTHRLELGLEPENTKFCQRSKYPF